MKKKIKIKNYTPARLHENLVKENSHNFYLGLSAEEKNKKKSFPTKSIEKMQKQKIKKKHKHGCA